MKDDELYLKEASDELVSDIEKYFKKLDRTSALNGITMTGIVFAMTLASLVVMSSHGPDARKKADFWAGKALSPFFDVFDDVIAKHFDSLENEE